MMEGRKNMLLMDCATRIYDIKQSLKAMKNLQKDVDECEDMDDELYELFVKRYYELTVNATVMSALAMRYKHEW